MKILTIDIETSPHLGHFWGLWKQNIGLNQLLEATEMLSFAAKWYGSKRPIFKSQYHHGRETMVEEAWKLLNEADGVVGWNSQRFDVRHIQREFIEQGLGPTSPFKNVDLMKACQKNFHFPSYKLEYVASKLLGESKTDTGGFQLWLDCLDGKRKAWSKMKEYNINDVLLTERLYTKLLPWLPVHPNANIWSAGETKVCGKCGSDHIVKDGIYTTSVNAFQQYRCMECGAWGRGREALTRKKNGNRAALTRAV